MRGVICALILLLPAMPARASGFVSLNLCTDDFLVLLAPERVAALSPLARDPALSVVAAQARDMPWVRADAEAVLALHPDMILATDWGAQAVLAVLERRGLRVERIALPEDFAAIRAETRRLAALLGVPERGETLLRAMDATLAGLPPPSGRRALLLQPRLHSARPGSLDEAVLRAAGLRDAGNGRQLGLETIVAHPPDVLVVPQAPDYPSLATDVLDHPVLRGIPRLGVPPALLACGGPWTARAVALLAR